MSVFLFEYCVERENEEIIKFVQNIVYILTM